MAKPGDRVEEGQPVLELHIDDLARVPHALEALHGAIQIGPEPPPHQPLVIDTIRA
jgi:thymidine phosphorylase